MFLLLNIKNFWLCWSKIQKKIVTFFSVLLYGITHKQSVFLNTCSSSCSSRQILPLKTFYDQSEKLCPPARLTAAASVGLPEAAGGGAGHERPQDQGGGEGGGERGAGSGRHPAPPARSHMQAPPGSPLPPAAPLPALLLAAARHWYCPDLHLPPALTSLPPWPPSCLPPALTSLPPPCTDLGWEGRQRLLTAGLEPAIVDQMLEHRLAQIPSQIWDWYQLNEPKL